MKKIGTFSPETPFFLAPMAGFTDSVYRGICQKAGASLTYTEMVSAKGLYYGDRKSPLLLTIGKDEEWVAYQIFGSDPDIMAWAAEKLEKEKNVILDINMGCPVPKVVKNGEGSALLRDPELIYRIVKKVAGATGKPVTIKMRLGIEGAPPDAHLLCSKAAEEGGAAAVAVHGRTREQYYSGEANLDAIKEVKEALTIPVIGNGDIACREDAVNMMEYTGCDFVMIGRAALGKPWIFSSMRDDSSLQNIAAGEGSSEEVFSRENRPRLKKFSEENRVLIKDMIEYHYTELEKLKGEYIAVREMRKFIPRYLKGVSGSSKIRNLVNTAERGEELLGIIRNL